MMMEYVKKPVEDSIRHWQVDIVEPLQAGRTIDKESCIYLTWTDTEEMVKCYDEDCALCQEYNSTCKKCYFTFYYGNPCYSSIWNAFTSNPCLETAQAMLEALKLIASTNGVSEITELRKKFHLENEIISVNKVKDKTIVVTVNYNNGIEHIAL
jgi:hypothetical protein